MYATVDNLKLAIGESRVLHLADREGEGVDAALIADALLRASAEIDAAISQRYALPLANVPTVLRSIAIDLAHYHLDLDPSDDLERRAKFARTQLADLRDGKTLLADAELSGSGDAVDGSEVGEDLPQVRPFKSSVFGDVL